MNVRDFNRIVRRRQKMVRETLLSKAKEYAGQNNDRLINFKIGARILGVTPEQSLLGMWHKHLASVLRIIEDRARGQDTPVAVIDEKIGDTIVYAYLLEALLTERRFH